ncbi:MAG: tryptophan--tRNA ligase [Candidatus Chisholmbacteria bacterium RIFCSPLOWO2_01_FULL_49_14]|uniref:Tryptophan--tRNA ligase n=1 Tax=Candidatus Chisholmbacteria bacterium RIFCSPLOWO2_01_FULL_49_14 TaxID=1797593 RepID=A0A1G1W0C8_9BACT|nr:MAG: tryptophan--tRNA ligase [Candidatus Chisholmbacteria bacterium RIFCSPLOWO2_01_FULL_49_14]
MKKKRVLSGIRATGRLHLGNYLGAVKGMLALQDDPGFETLYMIADLHTMTTPYDRGNLRSAAREVVLDYLACGLDPDRSVLFIQSEVAELHTQLAFYLSTAVSVARMQHLPTYKDKVTQYPKDVTMALLNYPVLMAADILIYKASKVPVGIDQEPHLEIAREIARKMNELYGMDFPEPTRFATESGYIPSLLGEGKMSKSIEGSYISLTDDLPAIAQRLAGAPTDSGQGKKVPTEGGVANLFTLVELFEGMEKRETFEKAYVGTGVRYQDLKKELAEAISTTLKPIQKRRRELEVNASSVDQVIQEGSQKARAIAKVTVEEVRRAMGLS